MQQGIVTKARAKPRNILRGIVPTFTGFDDTNPTNLSNATDGNATNGTGVGTKILTGAGTVGTFIFDFGSIKTAQIMAKIGISTSASTLSVYIEGSIDNNTYTQMTSPLTSTTSSSEVMRDILAGFIEYRYVRIRLYVSGAATSNITLYEVTGHELGV